MEDIEISMMAVAKVLDNEDVEDAELTVEVVVSALYAMKNTPNMEISEAIQFGFDEWIK